MSIEIKQLIGNATNSDIDSDSDQDLPLSQTAGVQGSERPSRFLPKKVDSIDSIVASINQCLKLGETIDLSKYPPLFVVNFRGTHFFSQFFTSEQRREVRQRIKEGNFKNNIYSPAVYELAGLRVGEPINTPEKKQLVYQAIKRLNEAFDKLAMNKPKGDTWYGKPGQKHETLLLQHYQRYVTDYEELRKESQQKQQECYQYLPSTSNPYISTADGARHAVIYALGGKTELTQGCLRPSYRAIPNVPQRAKHRKRAVNSSIHYH